MTKQPPESEIEASADRLETPVARQERWSGRVAWLSAMFLVAVVAKNAWQAHVQTELARSVRCDEPIFEFHQAFAADTIHHTFHIVNVGHTALTIARITTDCGCTTVDRSLIGRPIAPLGSADVPVLLRLSDSEAGELERRIVVDFADNIVPRTIFKLKGTVSRRWEWTPATIVFDAIPSNKEVTRTITVTQHPLAAEDDIDQVSTSTSLIRATVAAESSASTRRWTLTVRTAPPLPQGRQRAAIYLSSSHSRSSVGPISVILIVQ